MHPMRFSWRAAGPSIAFLAVLLLAGPSRGQGVGIVGGLNFSQLDDIQATDVSASFESSTGYHVGAFVDLGFGPVSIRPAVLYRDVGTYEFEGVSGDGELDLSAFEIPVDVRWRVLPLPLVHPYLLAGPVLTFPRSGDDSGGTEDVNLNADVGVGVELALGGLTLMPELRYGIATSSFLEDEFEVGGVTVRPQDDPRQNSVMLRLNVRF